MQRLSPPGPAGIAVYAVPPAQRQAVLASLRDRNQQPLRPPFSAPRLALLVLGGTAVDEVLLIDRGELGLELHTHGSAAVHDALAAAGWLSPAAIEEPAEQLLRAALGVAQLDLALEQRRCDFADWLQQLTALPTALRRQELRAALRRSRAALAMTTAPRLLLVGQQNAGKSSLFNHLLARERVLVGPQAGVTRDPVAELVVLAGYPYSLVDTPGLGPCVDAVDAAARQAAAALAPGALQILVIDAARGPVAADFELLPQAVLVIATKCELPPADWPLAMPCHLRLSSNTAAPGAAADPLGEALRRRRRLPVAGAVGGPAALEPRQWRALRQALFAS